MVTSSMYPQNAIQLSQLTKNSDDLTSMMFCVDASNHQLLSYLNGEGIQSFYLRDSKTKACMAELSGRTIKSIIE